MAKFVSKLSTLLKNIDRIPPSVAAMGITQSEWDSYTEEEKRRALQNAVQTSIRKEVPEEELWQQPFQSRYKDPTWGQMPSYASQQEAEAAKKPYTQDWESLKSYAHGNLRPPSQPSILEQIAGGMALPFTYPLSPLSIPYQMVKKARTGWVERDLPRTPEEEQARNQAMAQNLIESSLWMAIPGGGGKIPKGKPQPIKVTPAKAEAGIAKPPEGITEYAWGLMNDYQKKVALEKAGIKVAEVKPPVTPEVKAGIPGIMEAERDIIQTKWTPFTKIGADLGKPLGDIGFGVSSKLSIRDLEGMGLVKTRLLSEAEKKARKLAIKDITGKPTEIYEILPQRVTLEAKAGVGRKPARGVARITEAEDYLAKARAAGVDDITLGAVERDIARLKAGAGIPPRKPPPGTQPLDIPATPPPYRPRTLADLTREAKGMRAMTPAQRAAVMDIAKPIGKGDLPYSVRPFEEHAANLLGPDTTIMQHLRAVPGVKQATGVWTPAQMGRDNPIQMIGVKKAIFQEIEKGRARFASLRWWHDAEEILGFKNIKGVWKATKVKAIKPAVAQKKLFGTIDDLLEHPENYRLSKGQLSVLKMGRDMQTQLLRDAQRVGVDVVELGTEYWHRIVIGGPKDKMQGGWIGRRLGGRKGYTMQRAFEDIEPGIELGFKYETNPLLRLTARLEAGIQTIADREARLAIARLPGVEKPLERMARRFPETLEQAKVAREARDLAKSAVKTSDTPENWMELRQAEANYITAMRDVYAKKIEAGQPGYYELRLPNGRIAPQELVKEVGKYIELPELRVGGAGVLEATRETSQLLRTTLTNVDLAAGFIQGQSLFYRNNPAWWKAQFHGVVSLVDDPTAWVAKNFAVIDEGVRMGAISAPVEFLFTKGGLASIPTRIPVAGSVFKGFNRAFEWFILVGQTELYKAARARTLMKATGAAPKLGGRIEQAGIEDLVSLGSAIRKGVGTESYAILGVRKTQQTIEAVSLFAARFFRANVGLLAQSLTAGPGGAEARKLVGSLIAGGTALTIGINYAVTGKLPNMIDPYKRDWMQFPIGGTYFNAFGPFYTYLRTIARMSVSTLQGDPAKALREGRNFITSKEGIPFRAADIAGQLIFTGEARTFEGGTISKTPLGIMAGLGGELAVPISVQEAITAIPEGRPEAAIGEIFGLVGRRPQSRLATKIMEATGKPWESLDSHDKSLFYMDSANREMLRKTVNKDFLKNLELRWKYYDAQMARDELLAAGKMSGYDWKEAYQKDEGLRAAQLEMLNQDNVYPDPKTPEEKAINGYYDLQKKFFNVTTRIFDYEGWSFEKRQYLSGLTPELKAYVERNTAIDETPDIEAYKEYVLPLFEEYWAIKDTILRQYGQLENNRRYELLLTQDKLKARDFIREKPALLKALRLIHDAQGDAKAANPNLRKAFDFFYSR